MLIIEVSFRRHFVFKLKEKTAWIFDTYLHIWIFRLETSLDTISNIMFSNWKGESRWQVITSHWVSGENEQEVAAGMEHLRSDWIPKLHQSLQISLHWSWVLFIIKGGTLRPEHSNPVLWGNWLNLSQRAGNLSSSNSSWHTSFWPRHVEKRPCFAFYKADRKGREKKEEKEMDHREGITKG